MERHGCLRLVDDIRTIPWIDLKTQADRTGLDAASFRELAERSRAFCTVSRALAGAWGAQTRSGSAQLRLRSG